MKDLSEDIVKRRWSKRVNAQDYVPNGANEVLERKLRLPVIRSNGTLVSILRDNVMLDRAIITGEVKSP